jgi:hypothetical protein
VSGDPKAPGPWRRARRPRFPVGAPPRGRRPSRSRAAEARNPGQRGRRSGSTEGTHDTTIANASGLSKDAALIRDDTGLPPLLATTPAPAPDDITEAFWQACHGGQRRTAERLLASGADPSQTPGYSDQTAIQAAQEHGAQRDNLITWLQDRVPAT